MMEQQRGLQPGDTMPPFQAMALEGHMISDASLLGKPVWMAFFRHARCPFCLLRLYEMKDLANELRHVQVLGIFQSSQERLLQHIPQQHRWFTMIPDVQETLYQSFMVGSGLGGMVSMQVVRRTLEAAKHGYVPTSIEGTWTRIPADFLINGQGVIEQAFYGTDITEHIPLQQVRRWAAPYALQQDGQEPVA